ncbi:MAG: hypothetical protein WDN28_17655 [Chthoniobacter sp.]
MKSTALAILGMAVVAGNFLGADELVLLLGAALVSVAWRRRERRAGIWQALFR